LTASEAWPVLTGSLEQAVEQCSTGSCLRGMSSPDSRERHLLTLLTMPGLGLFKPHDLNPYTGTALLGLLTERHRPYSADEMEHFVFRQMPPQPDSKRLAGGASCRRLTFRSGGVQ